MTRRKNLDVKRKSERTRDALVEAARTLIAEKGIDATSVLDITEYLGLSNGLFYYHFKNMDQLLEVLGHDVIVSLIEDIYGNERQDPAERVVRGPLIIMAHADAHPEQRAILLRVIDDPEKSHEDLGEKLMEDIVAGSSAGRFHVGSAYVAMRFCRTLIGMAIRLRQEGNDDSRLGITAASQTLTLLGINPAEAAAVAEREHALLSAKQSSISETVG